MFSGPSGELKNQLRCKILLQSPDPDYILNEQTHVSILWKRANIAHEKMIKLLPRHEELFSYPF